MKNNKNEIKELNIQPKNIVRSYDKNKNGELREVLSKLENIWILVLYLMRLILII
jgi:hypothetical protein